MNERMLKIFFMQYVLSMGGPTNNIRPNRNTYYLAFVMPICRSSVECRLLRTGHRCRCYWRCTHSVYWSSHLHSVKIFKSNCVWPPNDSKNPKNCTAEQYFGIFYALFLFFYECHYVLFRLSHSQNTFMPVSHHLVFNDLVFMVLNKP